MLVLLVPEAWNGLSCGVPIKARMCDVGVGLCKRSSHAMHLLQTAQHGHGAAGPAAAVVHQPAWHTASYVPAYSVHSLETHVPSRGCTKQVRCAGMPRHTNAPVKRAGRQDEGNASSLDLCLRTART